MKVFVHVEPDYKDTFWCNQTLNGIYSECGKRRLKVCFIDSSSLLNLDTDGRFENEKRIMIVLGTSVSWLPEVLNHSAKGRVHVILVSLQPPENVMGMSCVHPEHIDATRKLLIYLFSLDCKQIALLGINPNSSADLLKAQCFCGMLEEFGISNPNSHVYNNYASLENCFTSFSDKAHSYDGVICANDVVAVSLIRHLQKIGMNVPNDILVASFGGTFLSRLTNPTLTTITLNHEELGRQAVYAYSYISKCSEVTSLTVNIACKIQVGESTMEEIPTSELTVITKYPQASQVMFYTDQEVNLILSIEEFLSRCDGLDLLIVHGLMISKRYSDLSEELFISENTLKYRLKRMLAHFSIQTKEKLVALLGNYLSDAAIVKAAGLKK